MAVLCSVLIFLYIVFLWWLFFVCNSSFVLGKFWTFWMLTPGCCWRSRAAKRLGPGRKHDILPYPRKTPRIYEMAFPKLINHSIFPYPNEHVFFCCDNQALFSKLHLLWSSEILPIFLGIFYGALQLYQAPQGQDKAAEAGTQAPRHGVEPPGAQSDGKGSPLDLNISTTEHTIQLFDNDDIR